MCGWSQIAAVLGDSLAGVPLSSGSGPSLPYAQVFATQAVGRLLRVEAGDGATIAHDDDLGHDMPQDTLTFVTSAEDLEENIGDGEFSAILHFEGAEMIDPDLYALETFHAAGLRSLGPVWSRSN